MKRSRSIRLVLTGAVAGAALTGCGPSYGPPVSADNTYTNNHFVHGAGYYHAPYSRWYPFPYNHYVAGQGYYHGGRWSPAAETPSTTASRPTREGAQLAESLRTTAQRSSGGTARRGFGGSSRSGIS